MGYEDKLKEDLFGKGDVNQYDITHHVKLDTEKDTLTITS